MKKVIYIEVDEEITSIYDRIKNLKQKMIYLVVPRKAVLFQSLVNLKILNSKLKELGQTMILVTSDTTGKHLADQLKIRAVGRIEVNKMEAQEEESPEMRIQPIQARRNEVLKEQPRRFTEKKITIAELIKEFRAHDKERKNNDGALWQGLHSFHANRKFLSLILVISISLFGLIGYIALPGATIYIRPTFDNLDHTVNITLADKHKNQNLLSENQPHFIASEEVITTTKQTKIFNTTSQRFQGQNAKGKITIVNTANEEWELKGETRFKTEDGLIFRSKEGVVVPPAAVGAEGDLAPGKIVITVEADPFDMYSKTVGGRGNIAPARFTMPGLSKYNQTRIWGESLEPMTGGTTQYEKVVLEEDIEAAKKQIKDNLILTAKEELKSYLDSKNKLNHTHLVLLDDRRYLKTELLDLRISDDLEGSAREKFEIFAKIKAQGIAYDSDQLFNLLKEELKGRTHPNMRLREESIYPDNVGYEVIDENDVGGQIKITATIKGIEEFIIEPSQEAGLRLGNKIKEKILGLKVNEAEKIINNFPEVDAVSIKTWPFWISSIPRIGENIKIKLTDGPN